MDFKRIIDNGYGKLVEKLPSDKKAVLETIKDIIDDLDCFKATLDMMEGFEDDKTILGRIKYQIAEEVIKHLKKWLNDRHDECLVAFVDNNNHSINEKGEAVKDE